MKHPQIAHYVIEAHMDPIQVVQRAWTAKWDSMQIHMGMKHAHLAHMENTIFKNPARSVMNARLVLLQSKLQIQNAQSVKLGISLILMA